MNYAVTISGWRTFREVGQDTEGVVVTDGSGLYTRGLGNCICVIVSDGALKCGMIHLRPDHRMLDEWVRSMVKAAGGTQMVLAGANQTKADSDRRPVLERIIADHNLTVVDETRHGFMDGVSNVTQGTYGIHIGIAAVLGRTCQYAFPSIMEPEEKSASSSGSSGKSGRKSQDGWCVIL